MTDRTRAVGRRRLGPLAGAALLAPAAAGWAQPLATREVPLDSGLRVRVTSRAAALDKAVGVVVRRESDTMTVALARGGRHVRMSLAALRRLEVSRGRTAGTGAVRGARIGALVVAIPRATLTAFALFTGWQADISGNGGRGCDDGCYFGAQIAGVLTLVGTAGGAAAGTLIGAAVGAERWDRVTIRVRTGAAPTPNRLGIAVRVGT